MKLASTIHSNGVRFPFSSEFNLLKPTQVTCPKSIPVRCNLRRSHYLLADGSCVCDRRYYSVAFKSIERRNHLALRDSNANYGWRFDREQETSTSYNRGRKASLNAINDKERPCTDTSGGGSGHMDSNTADYISSLKTVAFCVLSAVTFGIGLGFKDGVDKASEFFAGYLLEQSLSVDNLFVFVLIFNYFKVPFEYQNRVLSYGIAGAVFFRLSLILLGIATVQKFEEINLLLAAILLYSSFKLFSEEDEDTDLSDNFIVKTCQKFIPVTSNYDGNRFITVQNGMWKATPLLLTVAVIELSDIAFAVDSIPAVFGVTRDPFIVFTSNLFAILGLRSYYKLVSESMAELEYLQPAIAVILGFIGSKMILDFFGLRIPTEISLGFVAASLTTGVLLSLINNKESG
ncbi:thylakoid membrane protein TERC, chloroplastic isoform X2 [Andrographis paniculata]|uniref:thylakoid membrane protein TERC, chloroplastic isoform X2 n=1 Tax=Andrographis paniculata TaxID=175694 RepID=UPI0021E7DBF9|nr:thylakoid membrane protein TERC, chloroplastic isoform X2 [Andrographis paniculata]